MAYSDKVIDHYEHPRNVGALDKDAEDVGTGPAPRWPRQKRSGCPQRY